jgi:hypothetical protein
MESQPDGSFARAVDKAQHGLGRLADYPAARHTIEAARHALGLQRDDASSIEEVLKDEDRFITYARAAKGLPPPQTADARDHVGLAFSGGGIRSATFNLGVLQGLAKNGLLRHVDYLSTVSGGGYIGSWLVAWIKRLAERDRTHAGDAKSALDGVQALLTPDQPNPDDPALEPIRYLRRFSNYLTPTPSFFSVDTWSMAAIWFRNTLLNLAIVVCLIAVVLLPARFAGLWLLTWRTVTVSDLGGAWRGMAPEAVVSLLALLVASVVIAGNIRGVTRRARLMARKAIGHPVETYEPRTFTQRAVQWFVIAPATIGAAAVAVWMYRVPAFFEDRWSAEVTLFTSVGLAVITCFGGFPRGFAERQANSPDPNLAWRTIGVIFGLLFSALGGFVTAAMLYGVTEAFGALPVDWRAWAVVSFGTPSVLAVAALGVALQVGLIGRDVPDASREWLGRLRAWSIIYSGLWAGVFAASIFGPWLVYSLGAWATAAGGTWFLTTIAGFYFGSSERTGTTGEVKTVRNQCEETVAMVAPYVFLVGVFVVVAWGIHELVSPAIRTDLRHPAGTAVTLPGAPSAVALTVGTPERAPYTRFEARRHTYADDLARANSGTWMGFDHLGDIDVDNLGTLLLIALCAGGILAWRVDINEFSMHHFYKNRLVRCYLGASRRRRQPDPFTLFDNGDDFPLASICSGGEEAAARTVYCGPYPIFNAALNLSGGDSLAWQERQSASYAFTPLYSGFEKTLVDRETGGAPDAARHAYRPTATCGYVTGISAGTAMAVSGAAASPNSGYHTSTAVAFLLTILNARLGWWLGNPALKRYYKKSTPKIGLPYLLVELFGLANVRRKYVNLSDGGHFENLGIYELVRRRCTYIIACDGEQDSKMAFGGLAGVIRKCRTDFGVEIDINVDRLRLNPDRLSAAHCVLGTIQYPRQGGPPHEGYLLYVKSSLTGNEDPDVLEYRSRNPAFPHESTADQWFDESQFESYRRLGLHAAESAFDGVEGIDGPAGTYAGQKRTFFKNLELRHHPPGKTAQ